jgi:hypothetical protein
MANVGFGIITTNNMALNVILSIITALNIPLDSALYLSILLGEY